MIQIDKYKIGYVYYLWWIAFFLLPLVITLILSFKEYSLGLPIVGFTIKNYRELFKAPLFLHSFGNSILLSFTVASFSSILGLFMVSYSYSYGARTRNFLIGLCSVSFFGGTISKIFGLQIIISHINFLQFFGIYKIQSIVLGQISLILPISVIILALSRSLISEEMLQAAKELGSNLLQTNLFVVFPLMRASIVVSFIISFLLSISDVLVVDIIGGSRIYTTSLLINDYVKIDNWGIGAAATIVFLVILVLFVFFLSKFFIGKGS